MADIPDDIRETASALIATVVAWVECDDKLPTVESYAGIQEKVARAILAERERCIEAVLCPPMELYPDTATEDEEIEAAKKMGPVGACGYFKERGANIARQWAIAAIRNPK